MPSSTPVARLSPAVDGGLDVIAVRGDEGELRGDESAAGGDEQKPDAQGDEGTDQVHGRIPPWNACRVRPEGLGLSLGASLAALMISWCSSFPAPAIGRAEQMLQLGSWVREALWRSAQTAPGPSGEEPPSSDLILPR